MAKHKKGEIMLKFVLKDEDYFKLLRLKADLKCHTWDQLLVKLIEIVKPKME